MNTLRIATFNIENLDDKSDDRNPSLVVRTPILRNTLKRLKADIICFQEVHGQELTDHDSDDPSRELSALKTILQDTPYANYQLASTLTTDNVPYDQRNLVIASRLPILEINQYRNDFTQKLSYRKVSAEPVEDTAKNITWERPIQHIVLDAGTEGQIHIINLHLKSRLPSNIKGQYDRKKFQWNSVAGWSEGYFLSSMKRVGQALETRFLLESIFDQDAEAKIVVCGDFNAEPGEVAIEAIAGRVENTNNPELRSRVMVPCSSAISESVKFSHYHHGQGNLLDHMMISQAMLSYFQGAEIHNENLHDESLPFTFDIKYPESDHAPFVSAFCFTDEN